MPKGDAMVASGARVALVEVESGGLGTQAKKQPGRWIFVSRRARSRCEKRKFGETPQITADELLRRNTSARCFDWVRCTAAWKKMPG
jgi:hypothetical protein